MKCFYLLESAAVVGLMLLGGTAGFAKGGGHSHGGHSHSSHSPGSGSHHSSHHAFAHHASAHHASAHHSAPHHSSPHPAAQAFVAGHHGSSHTGHSWHHHGWGNGYWSNGYWVGSGDGYVAPVAVEPGYYDQYWSVAPTPVVAPATGEIVTNEYLNVTPPIGLRPSPSGPAETCPTAPSDGQ